MTLTLPESPDVHEAALIRTEGLSRLYRGIPAVQNLNLRVRAGRVYVLLGPNGAGKSTTLRMLLGLIRPSAGRIFLFRESWRPAHLARVGASIDGPALYDHLDAAGNLEVHTRLLGLPAARIPGVLARVGLADTGRRRAGQFSMGMRARLALGIALLTEPDVLLLDEPQNGLDPEGIRELRALLRAYAASGRTVLVSSHLLGEVLHLADDVGVMARGTLCYQGPLSGLAPDGDLEGAYLRLTSGMRA
ncbi:ATP-binding cassette domain-containing protein [Deinococcus apachensis]|uniref:ATP-binding cassette domain-containing protein n=1 Tax=Deinococcus apachensis TaxID=309886 RepID=UPI0006854A60|nr:ATP-binding cassette domain-containing protein [Deinococcus apachensis]